MEPKKRKNSIRRACVFFLALLFLFVCTGCDIRILPDDFLGKDLADSSDPEGPSDSSDPSATETLTGISLYVSSAEIAAGASFSFFPASSSEAAEEFDWVSFDDAVASAEAGTVTGLKMGETVISATSETDMLLCNVTVSDEAVGKKTVSTDALIAVGDALTLAAELPKGYEAAWSSSDEAVLSVSDGTVTALTAGQAEITAICEEFSVSYSVFVVSAAKDGGERVLLWSDEFDGDTLDPEKWEFQLGVRDAYLNEGQTAYGPWFWGNNELQYYTQDAVSLADGIMKITAERKDGLPEGRQFTSARIATRDRGFWTYGYFEARMKLPEGTGMWPAFWLLPQPEPGMGTNNRYGGWAANGEIDIMEAKGRLPYEVGNTLHYGGNPSTYAPRTVKLTEPISAWHTYGLEWRSDHISWFVDGVETFRKNSTSWFTHSPLGQDNASAPFDVPFYIIINLAVGGNYDGGRVPDASLTSAAMEVDYVRVYA